MESYLNIENIDRSNENREYHPLKPCVDVNTRVLFLGSFPPQRKRWAKGFDFFYPNFINDHWRIMGLLFFGNKDYFVDLENKTFIYNKVIAFVKEKGFGYYDTSEVVRRLKSNASDKFLEVITKTDISKLVDKSNCCEIIITTGEKATQNICEQFTIQTLPKTGECVDIPGLRNSNGKQIKLYRLPSSSRAYPMSLNNKAIMYNKVLSLLYDTTITG